MKRRLAPALVLLFCLFGMAGNTWAESARRDLPPDERRQMRQQMRQHWQQDREVRREEGGRRWQEVPPEDRRRLREDMREELREQRDSQGGGERRDGRESRRD